MKFKTSITNITPEGKEFIRGQKLTDLIANHTFTQTIFLILFGKLPSENEERMMNAIFTSEIDHGPAVASAMNARISASAGNSVHTALAAGVLGLGSRHGLPTEDAMKFLYEHVDTDNLPELLATMKANKQYVAGIGHKVFTTEDPRATALFTIAKETSIYGKHCEFMQRVHEEVNKNSSKELPINVDGAIAPILCDMGVDYKLGKGMFIIGRVPGLIAHIHEEQSNDVGIRRIPPEEIEFVA